MGRDTEGIGSRRLHYRLDFRLREGNLPNHDLVDGALKGFPKLSESANRDGTFGGHRLLCSVALGQFIRFKPPFLLMG